MITVRPVAARDAEAWAALFAGYRAFYRLPADPDAVATTWGWVLHEKHSLFGIVAVDESDSPVALANLRWFARPSVGRMGLYLDDLFTSPDARGSGAATALLRRAAEIAAGGDASVVRWITAEDNTTARALYDRLAVLTPYRTYDMEPSADTGQSGADS